MTYYTLLLREHLTAPWRIEFGDTDIECVRDERDSYVDDGVLLEDTKIVITDGTQAAIDEKVSYLNSSFKSN